MLNEGKGVYSHLHGVTCIEEIDNSVRSIDHTVVDIIVVLNRHIRLDIQTLNIVDEEDFKVANHVLFIEEQVDLS